MADNPYLQWPVFRRSIVAAFQRSLTIALGASAKQAPFYEIRRPGFVGSTFKPRLGYFTTPYLRIAQAAYNAKKQYKPFGEGDVTAEMTVSELHVYGMAQAVGARAANVQPIVITPKGERDPGKAIRPTSVAEVPVEFRNLMGMEAGGKGLMAVFPLEALRNGFEVHIIYDVGVPNGSRTSFCEDCFVEFDLGKIK
ncbi:MAG: hypothetical protein LC753_20745 [Acidobacteria bacterium]|nr:hypothetical protein [Acidobacteriota bacterium]MCA1652585.1 hypothetical protein [Acidobacteriota bacterium]